MKQSKSVSTSKIGKLVSASFKTCVGYRKRECLPICRRRGPSRTIRHSKPHQKCQGLPLFEGETRHGAESWTTGRSCSLFCRYGRQRARNSEQEASALNRTCFYLRLDAGCQSHPWHDAARLRGEQRGEGILHSIRVQRWRERFFEVRRLRAETRGGPSVPDSGYSSVCLHETHQMHHEFQAACLVH